MRARGKILVVDDDAEVLRALSLFLRSAGLTVIEGSTGQEGLDLLAREKPELALLDAGLPDMEGLEVCRRIKADPDLAHTFVIIISGSYTSSEDQVHGLDAGADGYVAKSIHPQELVARIESLLRIANAEKGLRQARAELEARVGERTAALEKINREMASEMAERRRVEEALKKNEERLRFLLMAAPAVIYSCRPTYDFGCTFISENVRQQLGHEPSEFIANSRFWIDSIHPEDRVQVLGGLGQLFQQGEHVLEYRFRRQDGSYCWMRDEVRLIRGAEGHPVELAGCLVDITGRKQMEEALRSKTEQLQAVTDAMTTYLRSGNWQEASAMLLRSALRQSESEQGFIGVVADGPHLLVLAQEGMMIETPRPATRAAAAASNSPASRLSQLTALEVLMERVLTGRRSTIVNGRPSALGVGSEGPSLPPWRSFLGVPIFREGEIVGMIGVANRPSDYTAEEDKEIAILAEAAGVLLDSFRRQQRATVLEVERRAAVEQVGESRRQYQELVESLEGIIWEADVRTFQFTFVSQHCERLLGYSVAQWMSEMTWQKLIHPEDLESVFAACALAVKEKRNHSLEYRVVAADGRVVWVRDIATVVVKDDVPRKLIGVLLDVTDRRTAEEQLLGYQKKLRSLASEMELTEERERRRIALDLHDHIGQSLAITKIKLDELLARAAATEWAVSLGELRDVVQQTIQDARSLLFEISPPVLHELGLGAALECLAEQLQNQHGIEIEFEEDREVKSLPHDARTFLFKAVRELLLNVVKHARARHARITLKRQRRFLRIVVTDDGQGFQVADPHHDSARVSGFGLFSLRERLDYTGGKLIIDSAPGKGSQITILTPLKGGLKA